MPSAFAGALIKEEFDVESAAKLIDILPENSYAKRHLGNYLNFVGHELYEFLHLEEGPRGFMDALTNAIDVALHYDLDGGKNKDLNPLSISFFRPRIAIEIADALCPDGFAESVRVLCGYKPRAS